jgi:hypothetical protein
MQLLKSPNIFFPSELDKPYTGQGLTTGRLDAALLFAAISAYTAAAFYAVGDITGNFEGVLNPALGGHGPLKFGSDAYMVNVVGHALVGCGMGAMRVGAFVTVPGEVSGLSQAGIEIALEIQAGRGAFSTMFTTTWSNLATPFNGPLTSGGALQWHLIRPVTHGPFLPTP